MKYRPHNLRNSTENHDLKKCQNCDGDVEPQEEYVICNDCGMMLHSDCEDVAPIPCIPRWNMPETSKSYALKDACSPVKPLVPPVLIRLFSEIEKPNRIKENGIYQKRGSKADLVALFTSLQQDINYVLSSFETVDLTELVFAYFTNFLDDTLIPSEDWKIFDDATSYEEEDIPEMLRGAVLELPDANRHTLAFVMTHIKAILEENSNGMDKAQIVEAFALPVVGYPEDEATKNDSERILAGLMEVNPQLWEDILICRRQTCEFDDPYLMKPLPHEHEDESTKQGTFSSRFGPSETR